MWRPLTASLVCTTLLSSTAWAAAPKVDAKLFPSANSKLYIAQSLLHDDENWDVAYEILRDVIKNDTTINSVSKKKVKQAASIIRSYNLQKPFFGMTGHAQYKTRPYIEAQLYLAEALMDSRIFLNQSYDSEVQYVDTLLKNYFFPLQADKVKIIYPNAAAYAFNKWSFSKEVLDESQTGVAVEGEDFFNFLGDNNSSTATSGAPSGNTSGLGGPKGIPTPPNFNKPVSPVAGSTQDSSSTISATPVTAPPIPPFNPNMTAGSSVPKGVASAEQEKGIIEDAAEVVDVVVDLSDKAKVLMDAYQQYEQKNNRINNKYLAQSMLVQALAEPGSVLVDPQLQEFLKGIRIEYSLGEVEMPKQMELDEINDNLGDNIIKGDAQNIQIDLSKLFAAERAGTYSAMKLEYRSMPGKAGRATLFVISSVSGEDLMFNRVLQHAATLAKNADAIAASKAAEAGSKVVNTVPKFLVHLGEALQKTVRYGKEADTLGAYAGAWNSSKKALVWGLTKAEAPRLAISKMVQSPGVQKVMDYTVRTKFVQNGHLFHSLVALGVLMEVTTGIIEMNNAETVEDRRHARNEMLARTGAQLLYLVPYVGVAAMTVDFLHFAMGLPVETADVFRGAEYLGESIGLWMAGYNHTTFRLAELELKYKVPLHEVYIWEHAFNLKSISDAVEGKQMIYNQIQQTSLNNLSVIYLAHRSTKDRSNYDFGKRLAEYKTHYEKMNIEVAKKALKKIDGQIEGLRMMDQINSDLSQSLERKI